MRLPKQLIDKFARRHKLAELAYLIALKNKYYGPYFTYNNLNEIALKMNLSKSHVFNLLNKLTETGFIRHNKKRKTVTFISITRYCKDNNIYYSNSWLQTDTIKEFEAKEIYTFLKYFVIRQFCKAQKRTNKPIYWKKIRNKFDISDREIANMLKPENLLVYGIDKVQYSGKQTDNKVFKDKGTYYFIKQLINENGDIIDKGSAVSRVSRIDSLYLYTAQQKIKKQARQKSKPNLEPINK